AGAAPGAGGGQRPARRRHRAAAGRPQGRRPAGGRPRGPPAAGRGPPRRPAPPPGAGAPRAPARARGRRRGRAGGRRADRPGAARPDDRPDHPALELTELLREAVAAGVVGREDAELIARSRIGGQRVADIAARRGLRPRTLWARRQRAESALATALAAS